MAKSMMIAAALLMGLCLCGVVSGQGMAPESSAAPAEGPSSASDDCSTKLLNMSDCLTYVTEGSNVTKPENACCQELAGMVDSNPICLCQLFGNNNTYGIKIDMTRALKLPSTCGVSTPPVQLCSAITGVPVGGPTASEGPGIEDVGDRSPAGSPTASERPGGQAPGPGGLAADPSAVNNNGASSSPSSVLAILAGLAFAFLPSFF